MKKRACEGERGETRSPAFFLQRADIDAALRAAGRVYLTGHLERAQEHFAHVGTLDSAVEVGMTRYERPTADQAHLHTFNTDLCTVLKGVFHVRLLASGQTGTLRAGDWYVIRPGEAHVCVAEAGTEVLFIKVPGGNDKVCVDLDEASAQWVQEILCLAC